MAGRQIRRGTAAERNALGGLAAGELGFETDTEDVYIGAAAGDELISDKSARDFLNGQDQAVKTTSSPIFVGLDFATQKNLKLVIGGDSLSNDADEWPYLVKNYNAIFARGTIYNFAVGGQTAAIIDAAYATTIGTQKASKVADECYLWLLAGTNDVAASTAYYTIYLSLKSIWAKARADGFKIVAFTIPPSTGFTVGNGKETIRLNLNALILSDPTLYDYLIQSDIILPDASDTDYFSDGTHPTALGHNKIAREVAIALGAYRPFMVIAGDNNYDNFSTHDLIINPQGRRTGFGRVGILLGKVHISETVARTAFLGTDAGTLVLENLSGTDKYVALDFYGNQGKPQSRIASIQTASGSNLVFGITNSFASGITKEALRIDHNGYVLVNGATGVEAFCVNGNVNLSSGKVFKIGTLQVVGAQAATQAALKADYTTGDLDTEAEIIAALNASNAGHNALLAKIKTHGLIASA